MSRSRDLANARAAEQVEKRRRATAHRGLRTSLARRTERSGGRPQPRQSSALLGGAGAVAAVRVDTAPAPIAVPEPMPEAPEAAAAPAEEHHLPSDPVPVSMVAATELAHGAPVYEPYFEEEAATVTAVLDPVDETTILDPVDGEAVDETAVLPPVEAAGAVSAEERAEPARRSRWPWIIGLLVLVALIYIGAQAALAGTTPRGTTSLGTDIGAMRASDAASELDSAASAMAESPVTVGVGEATTQVVPSDIGLGVDAQATVAQVTGFTLNPMRLVAHVFGGGEIDPVLQVDDDALDAGVMAAAADIDSETVDAAVVIEGGVASAQEGAHATHVDQEGAAAILATQWLEADTIELPATEVEPDVTYEDADAYAAWLNSTVLSGDITLAGGGASAALTPAQFSAGASVVSDGGELDLVLDGEQIAAAVAQVAPATLVEPGEPTFDFDGNHQLVVTEGDAGSGPDAATIADAVLAAAQTTARAGELPIAEIPAVTAAEEGAADFQEIVASFDTPLTNDSIRTQNLIAGAAHVQGTILMPGDEFNLIDTLGDISTAEGYVESWVLVNNLPARAMGGGLSQMATTTYNAAYFAGLDITNFQPHSVYYDRYPAGRESTVWTGGNQINVEFTNDTPYAMILDSYVANNRVYVAVWSTPHYTVETQASSWTDIVQPTRVEVDITQNPECVDTAATEPGFLITNYRQVYLDGEQVKDESFTWRYAPHNGVKCVDPGDQADEEN